MKVHLQSVAAVGLLTLLPACSSDDDESGKPVDLKVGFGVSATIAQEDASYLEVDVVLNRTSESVLIVISPASSPSVPVTIVLDACVGTASVRVSPGRSEIVMGMKEFMNCFPFQQG